MVEVADAPTSFILLEELFESEDPRFLDEVFGCIADRKLRSFGTRWYRDKRPWARRALLAYVDDGCDRARHRALVRRLLVLAETAGDDELMAHLLCAFDGLVRRAPKTVRRWNYRHRSYEPYRMLVQVHPNPKRAHSPEAWKLAQAAPKGNWRERAAWFGGKGRQYLKRRAYRYFRTMAYREPERYAAGLIRAMGLYTDAHLPEAANILDTYGLTSLIYYSSPVIQRNSRRLIVGYRRQLAELEPAPRHPEALHGHAEAFIRLLFRSNCLLIRRWIVAWLEREEAEAMQNLNAAQLRPLLMSNYGDVQAFAARRLETAEGMATLSIEDWLELLRLDNPEVVHIVCKLVEEHVRPDRLDFATLVELARSAAAPVAELGFSWLKERTPKDAEALHVAMQLANARTEPVRKEAVSWLLGIVTSELGQPAHLRDLIDARHRDVRALALDTMAGDARFKDDVTLWAALSESPYPDVMHFLVQHLEAREATLSPEQVERAWASTLLSVHRGSRAKRAALRQITARVVASPERADALLPLLRISLRSVREAERRGALAAVAQAAFREPSLRDKLAAHVPELSLFDARANA